MIVLKVPHLENEDYISELAEFHSWMKRLNEVKGARLLIGANPFMN